MTETGLNLRMRIEGAENVRVLFSLFHDGSIVSWATDGDELQLEVEIKYLAERIDPKFRKFDVRLFGVSDIQFSTWPNDLATKPEVLTEPTAIFAGDLEVLEGNLQAGMIEVVCNQHSQNIAYSGGELRFGCVYATVTDEAGKAYSIEELGNLCKGYWEEWSKRNQV